MTFLTLSSHSPGRTGGGLAAARFALENAL